MPDQAYITSGGSMDSESELMRRIAIVATGLGAASAVYAMVTQGRWAALSSALGTLVGLANVAAITKIITQLIDRRAESAQLRAGVFLVFKTVVLFALVGLIVTREFILSGWFTVGITMSVFALILGGLWGSPPSDGAPRDPDEGKH